MLVLAVESVISTALVSACVGHVGHVVMGHIVVGVIGHGVVEHEGGGCVVLFFGLPAG